MKNSLMAIKPFIEKIEGYLNPLSKEHLTEIIINLAKEEQTNRRIEFLNRIAKFLPDSEEDTKHEDTGLIEEIMNEIETLRERIKERVDSIEDGSYNDDPDKWNAGYYDEEPDYVNEDRLSDLKCLFDTADDLVKKITLGTQKMSIKPFLSWLPILTGLMGMYLCRISKSGNQGQDIAAVSLKQ